VLLQIPDWQPQAPLQPMAFDWSEAAAIQLAVLRLDLIDPLLSGNKWFKLRPHLQAARQAGARGLISPGGAHSNHLHALAAAGQRFAFPTIGLLRGEPQETPTVADLQAFGMQLHWLGYGGYRARHQADFAVHWQRRHADFQFVPEGGGGLLGASGFGSIPSMLASQLGQLGWTDYDGLWLAVGSGTTLAGLVLAEAGRHPLYGALVVPERYGVAAQVGRLLQEASADDAGYRLLDASRGGYGRIDAELAGFIRQAECAGPLPLEGCYTGKALLALRQQVQAGRFARGTRLVFLHTGGLQGRRAQQQVLAAPAIIRPSRQSASR
jgi:1-aminocyclopropane-1-carboxylate deaminase